MKRDWLKHAEILSTQKADFYSGARKIIRNQRIEFGPPKNNLKIEDCGYTKSKLTMLEKGYFHEESIAMAVNLWDRRLGQKKYGSVGFTTYNHFIKRDPNKKSKRASVMGPCIQAGTLTLLNNGTTAVDFFYRTTEFYKKFPADLVFIRDRILTQFNFENCPISTITFHFANVTCHPMYYVTLMPFSPDPVGMMADLRDEDEYFWKWVVKWTARYLCEEYFRGIEKFSQALRVRMKALELLPAKKLPQIQEYLRDNHPGYRSDKK